MILWYGAFFLHSYQFPFCGFLCEIVLVRHESTRMRMAHGLSYGWVFMKLQQSQQPGVRHENGYSTQEYRPTCNHTEYTNSSRIHTDTGTIADFCDRSLTGTRTRDWNLGSKERERVF